MRIKLISIISLILLFFSTVISCAPASNFSSRLNTIVKPYRFSMLRWEVGALSDTIRRSLSGPPVSINDTQTVMDYFAAVRQNDQTAELTNKAEKILELQIRSLLNQEDIHNPFENYAGFLKFNFPPIDFALAEPPYILIISPRDKIEIIDSIMLIQDLTAEEMENIETEAEQLDVSALVDEIGGLGATFPTFVNYKSDLRSTIDGATEEWLHQYLALTPLGWRYVLHSLGIHRDYDAVTINETVASMVSEEIGSMVYDKYYAAYEAQNGTTDQNQQGGSSTGFDFNATMRQIRLNVDAMLAAGEIDQAEQYMENQRQFLVTKGYYIRKLNQAYFAFYGSYADSPTSVNPIGAEIQGIRAQSPSLSQFLDNISKVTSVSGLDKLK